MVREERFTLLMPMPGPRCCGSFSMTRLAPGVGELLAELQKSGESPLAWKACVV